jgi:hypothetical protein
MLDGRHKTVQEDHKMSTTRQRVMMAVVLLMTVPTATWAQEGDAGILAAMERINRDLELRGLTYRLAHIDLYTLGWGQPSHRILMNGCRWVPYDFLRYADGDNITYLVVASQGVTASGLSSAATEAAIDRAMTTWDRQKSLQKVDIVKRDATGDCTIFDEMDCWAAYDDDPSTAGWPFGADIVHAGWYPSGFFECFEPGGGYGILGVSVTFIWVDTATDLPTDINGDGYLDTALPGVDVETVALHEAGHALGLGHFGPPPNAVMDPYYEGIDQEPSSVDNAGLSALWRSWPNQ